jgi:hypothetical protein
MIRGLQITRTGEELSRRIGERIRVHEIAISALDARLEQRRGDQEFDVRAEDGFKTVGELEKERQQYLASRSHGLIWRRPSSSFGVAGAMCAGDPSGMFTRSSAGGSDSQPWHASLLR